MEDEKLMLSRPLHDKDNNLFSFNGSLVDEESMFKPDCCLIRDCFWLLHPLMLQSLAQIQHSIVVTGTLGVGKSTFRNFVLWKLLDDVTKVRRVIIIFGKGES